jgi:hypothetical protein
MENNVSFRAVVILGDGRYDCEIDHPRLGWIPFTASQFDVEAHGRAIWAAIEAAE